MHTLYRCLLRDGELPTMAMAGSVGVINERRIALGLAPVRRLAELLDASAGVLVATLPEIDAAGAMPLPVNVHYVGPLLEDAGADGGWKPPWPADDARPLVVVCMGTTPMGEEQALQRVLDAVARLDVRVLVNAGMHLDTARLRRSDNTILSRYVRHAAVLPAARLLVTHAGLGSVSMALSFGVPMVCLPLGREQPVNAERVAALGAGRVVAGTADADAIAGAITNVIDDAAYAEAARGMAGKIGAVAAAGPAARLLEDCASGIDADPGKPASG